MFYPCTPQWFSWMGRPVLPIFIFLCAEAFAHTRNRRQYLFRLFICFLSMKALSMLLTALMPVAGVELYNNVFQTLFLCALYMLSIELLRAGIREKNQLALAGGILFIMIPIAVVICSIIISDPPVWLFFILFKLVPNILGAEGGFAAVILGIVFYLFRKNRLVQVLIFSGFCILSFIISFKAGLNTHKWSGGSIQWLMIFALIPIMLYNGQRGSGNKYFFYVFYPAHIYFLYVLAWVMG
jgi:hypothetical protein